PFAEAVKGPHEHLARLGKYLVKQCELQGVTLVNNTEVTADFIAEKNPDAVILAVGGKRVATGLTSTAATNVISVDDLLGGSAGDQVVIVGGNMQAVDAALYLMDQGKKVTIVSPYSKAEFEKGHSVNVQEFIKPAIFAAGLKLYPNANVTKVGEGQITFTTEAGIEMTLACDTVVEALDMVPNTELMDGLSVEAIAVGDCIDPYNIASAIATGNLAGRKI
ncbi:MAG: FAD-dependent oxidoreductase, partial [Lachnospiraceae bacterium]|nr:FAD-dependent oxidoreductase [Lachnospiraceae bacterium]